MSRFANRSDGLLKSYNIAQELIELAKFLFGFLPWLVFLVLPTDSWASLRRAVLICLVLSIALTWKQLRLGFILQWATVAFFLFSVVAFYGFEWIWLADHMAVTTNAFLDGVIWLTVLIGKPFTLQYARAELPPERWHDEGLVRSCQTIAIFWAVLLLVPTAFNAFRLLYPSALPGVFYFSVSVFCIVFGAVFTTFYKRLSREHRGQGKTAASMSE